MKNKFTIFLVLLLALSVGIQSAVAEKPLTTITFDEVPEQRITSIYINGVTFELPYYGPCGAQIVNADNQADGIFLVDMRGNSFQAESLYDLMMTFDKPTTVLGLDFATAVNYPVFVDLYRPGIGSLRDTQLINVEEAYYYEGHFAYRGPAIQKAVINFPNQWPTEFWVDTVVFQG